MDIYRSFRIAAALVAIATSSSALANDTTSADIEAARSANENTLGIKMGSADSGVQQVLQRMNRAATYSTEYRLKMTADLFNAPIKTRLQTMTCLDKIMAIKFVGLSSISFSSVVNSIIQAAIQALINAACSLVDQAYNSAMNRLTEMTRIDMGANTSVNLANTNGGNITVGPQFSSSNPYVSQAMGAAQPGQFGSAQAINQPAQQTSNWEAFKNIFK